VIYCYPRLSQYDLLMFRFLGPGLGNLLFPWARAVAYAHETGSQVVAPTWPQLKFARLLRGDADRRLYRGMFTAHPDWLSGASRVRTLLTAPRVPEHGAAKARDGNVIEFVGMAGQFGPFLRHHELIAERLHSMTRTVHKAGLAFDFRGSISLHVRMGDFVAPVSAAALASGAVNLRIPMAWYTSMVEGVRQRLGAGTRVYVFSDGTDEELRELLALPGCQRLGFGSAIADLLALSRSRALIASGSTYSMWASFLGRMPVIWHPGQLKHRLYSDDTFEREVPADGSSASHAAFDALCADVLSREPRR
jgi:hypothetical protein